MDEKWITSSTFKKKGRLSENSVRLKDESELFRFWKVPGQ
jgi:hypothetical protein